MSTEVEPLLTRTEAEALTVKIREQAEVVWWLLKRAHDGRAYLALGYPSWATYVRAEFDMSRSNAYRLLAHAATIRDLAEVAGIPAEAMSTSERYVRGLDADDLADEIRGAVGALPVGDTLTRAEVAHDALRRAARRQRAAAARKALRRQEAATLARRTGGDLSTAYSHVRKAIAAVDAAQGDARDAEERAALDETLRAIHRTEDSLTRALRLSRREMDS